MSFSSILRPRQEVISDEGIEGIIDLANLAAAPKAKLETRPEDFFDLTYPTADVRRVIEQLHRRFQPKSDVPGLFLFEGLKGSGKSHLLLLIHNLFQHSDIAQPWLASKGLKCDLPKNAMVIVNKFTDNSTYCIWDLIFERLGYKFDKSKKPSPGLKEFKEAIGDRQIVLIFDELEQGIRVIDDKAVQAQNVAFLQMVSEFASRSDQVTLFASIYSNREEPGETLKRVSCIKVLFASTDQRDRNNVILHRLFENGSNYDQKKAAPVIDSYINLWGRFTSVDAEALRQRFAISYPFTPFLMDAILKRIPARGGFQNVRGALGFLCNMVKLTYQTNDIISTGDASLRDAENVARLSDLDVSGYLIRRATENLDDLASHDYSVGLASSVLLSTLAGSGSNVGITQPDLVQEMMRPDRDINCLNKTIGAFQKYASYFHYHQQDNRYYFDLEENAEAKIEFTSLKVSDDEARQVLFDTYRQDVFRETASTVVYTDIDTTKQQLNQCDKKRLRYVLTTRRLSQEERHKILFGLDFRNLILLLEPKDDQFQLATNKDLLKWAKRCIAAQKLIAGPGDKNKKTDYERIMRKDEDDILKAIKKAGLSFVHWEKYAENVSDDVIELEPIGGDCSKDKVLETLNQTYFPTALIKEHLEKRLQEIMDRLVKEVEGEYRSTLGFPVPTMLRSVSVALQDMCREKKIGIQHVAGSFCGEKPPLSETEFIDAKIIPPFETGPVCSTCGQTPCVCNKPCPKCGQQPCICEPTPCPVCGKYPCVCGPPSCPKCGQSPCVCKQTETKVIGIPSQASLNALRQQAAFRLEKEANYEVTQATYKIYLQKQTGDLSSLPAALRGNLSGQGDIVVEVQIRKSGKFTKSQIETQIEYLPSFTDAEYSADLTLLISAQGT